MFIEFRDSINSQADNLLAYGKAACQVTCFSSIKA